MVFLIKEVMQREFLTAPPDRDVFGCIQEMVRRREGFLLVVDQGRTIGIVTERDLIGKVLATGRDPHALRVHEIASQPVKSVEANTPTMDVVEEMSKGGLRRVAVVEGGRTVGVVTGRDLFRAFRKYVDQVSTDVARLQSTSP